MLIASPMLKVKSGMSAFSAIPEKPVSPLIMARSSGGSNASIAIPVNAITTFTPTTNDGDRLAAIALNTGVAMTVNWERREEREAAV